MSNFKREHRYWVAKVTDVEKYLSAEEKMQLKYLMAKVDVSRQEDGKPKLECVCIESDWPEYAIAWDMIQARVEGNPNIINQLRTELAAVTDERNELKLFRWQQGLRHAQELAATQLQLKEAREALEFLYDRWESGDPVSEMDFDGEGSPIGKCFDLTDEEENRILRLIPSVLNNNTRPADTTALDQYVEGKVKLAVAAAIELCKGATGQKARIDTFVNSAQIVHDVMGTDFRADELEGKS